jgi:hypothetical protein
MKMLLWTASLVCLALWSLLAWGTSGLVGAAQSWAPALGDDPLGVGLTAANFADWLGLAGRGVILVVWAIGAIVLIVGTMFVSRGFRAIGRITRGRRNSHRPMPLHAPYRSSGSSMHRLVSRLAPRLLRAVRR